jgi:hypothetical protein
MGRTMLAAAAGTVAGSLLAVSVAFGNPTCTDGEQVTGPWLVSVGSLYTAIGWLQVGNYDRAKQAVDVAKGQLAGYSKNLGELISRRKEETAFAAAVKNAVPGLEAKRVRYEERKQMLAGSQTLSVWTDVKNNAGESVEAFLNMCPAATKTVSDAVGMVESRIGDRKKLMPEEILALIAGIETSVLTASYVSIVILP